MKTHNSTASKWLQRISGFMAILVLTLSFSGNASARVLFQDDTFQDVMSDALRIGSNDAGAANTAIQFGNDSTAAENGLITWNITTNMFDIASGVNLSSATNLRLRESSDPNSLAACVTTGEVIVNTTSNSIMLCTTTGVAGVAIWAAPSPTIPTGAANPGTCSVGSLFFNTTLSALQVCTATDTWNTAGPQNFEDVYNWDGDQTLTTSNGAFTVSTGTNDFIVNSNDWNVTAAGALDAATITSNGLFTGLAGATVSGAAINLNASSNFATNIGTGTTTATVSIGGGSNSVAINSSTWDISAAGAASGFTTFTGSGDITTTGGDLVIGTIGLNDVGTSNTTSGASLVGAFDEFANSDSTTVQDILDDFDALIGSNAANTEVLTFHPEYPDTVVFPDGTNNAGTLSSDYDNTNDENYYHWQSNNATTQDMDLKFRFPLPADYVTTGDLTYRYRTGTTTEADNDMEITLYNATDETAGNPTSCGADTTNGTANAWATGTVTAATLTTGCTGSTALNAGDIVEIDIRLTDNSGAGDFADVGFVSLAYSN